MKYLLAVSVVVALAGTALATGTGGFSGRITDRTTGNPIEGAVIIARGPGGMGRAQTNARGVYAVRDLVPGLYRAKAMARGCEPAEFPRPIPVRAGQITPDINGSLQPVQHVPGRITGRVVDRHTGNPIEGAVVLAHSDNCRRKARTNARGIYVVDRLPTGTYRLKASARHYLPAVFPRGAAVRSGQVVENIDFALLGRPRAGAVAGRVFDARTRQPIAGAVVLVRGENGYGRAAANRRGGYRVAGLAPGRYQVRALARGYEPATWPRPVVVEPGVVTGNVDFPLRRGNLDLD